MPIKTIKVKDKDQFPWEDKQLIDKRKLRDFFYFESKTEPDKKLKEENISLYKLHRSEYQTLNRLKIKEYFATKTSKDFKNSKKYWQFYSASIKIKSDKATKFEIVRKIANKEAATVLAEMDKILAFTLLPFKTITSDNGTEFALHCSIEKITGSEFYFADPYSSWQRGLNEHQNGLIRDFYPKRTDFREVSDTDIAKVERNLNNRPRKSLGFLTPAEVMLNHVKLGTWCT